MVLRGQDAERTTRQQRTESPLGAHEISLHNNVNIKLTDLAEQDEENVEKTDIARPQEPQTPGEA